MTELNVLTTIFIAESTIVNYYMFGIG